MIKFSCLNMYNLGVLFSLILCRCITSTLIRGNVLIKGHVHDEKRSITSSYSFGSESKQRRRGKKKSKESKSYHSDEAPVERNSTTFMTIAPQKINTTNAPSLSPTKSANDGISAKENKKIMKKGKDPSKKGKISKEKKTVVVTPDVSAYPTKSPEEKIINSRDDGSKKVGGSMSSKKKGKGGKGEVYFAERTRTPIHSPTISVPLPSYVPTTTPQTKTDSDTMIPLGKTSTITFSPIPPIPPTIIPTNIPISISNNSTATPTTVPATNATTTNVTTTLSGNVTAHNVTAAVSSLEVQKHTATSTGHTLYSSIFRPIDP